jgi:hypothetical protein
MFERSPVTAGWLTAVIVGAVLLGIVSIIVVLTA